MSVRSGLAASGHRDRLVTLYNIILKFIIIVQISNLLINEVREDPRLFHDADGSIKGVVTVSPIVIGTLVCKSFTDKFPKSNVYNIPISCKETMCIV